MFIHDFVPIGRPLDAVVDEFGPRVDPWLATMVARAWATDRSAWEAIGLRAADITPPPTVAVRLGPVRVAPGRVIVPVSWPGGPARCFPALDADLEIAEAGPYRTHLQLMGRYSLPLGVDPWSREGSLAHRATVAAVRRLLELLAARLEHDLDHPAPPFQRS